MPIGLPAAAPLALLGATMAIYLGLLIRYTETAHLGMSGLFLAGAASMLWDRRHQIKLGTSRPNILACLGLVAVVGVMSFYLLQQYGLYADRIAAGVDMPKHITFLLRSLPFLSGLSAALLAVGGARLSVLWRELAILIALGLPGVLAAYTMDISPITARFSTALLWYSGFDVIRDGVYIFLGEGGVKVYSGCSGLESMAYLLGLSGLCLIMFPLKGQKRWLIPMVGLAMGFFINSIRVALMTLLVAAGNKSGFDYWHTGDGSLLFGVAAVVSFGAFYMGIQTLEQLPKAAASTSGVSNFSDQERLSTDVLKFLEQEGE